LRAIMRTPFTTALEEKESKKHSRIQQGQTQTSTHTQKERKPRQNDLGAALLSKVTLTNIWARTL